MSAAPPEDTVRRRKRTAEAATPSSMSRPSSIKRVRKRLTNSWVWLISSCGRVIKLDNRSSDRLRTGAAWSESSQPGYFKCELFKNCDGYFKSKLSSTSSTSTRMATAASLYLCAKMPWNSASAQVLQFSAEASVN